MTKIREKRTNEDAQTERNRQKARAIIRGYAEEAARKAGVAADFFMNDMKYDSLVELFRGLMGEEGLCLSCGRAFANELDIQIVYRWPPRGDRAISAVFRRCRACRRGSASRSRFHPGRYRIRATAQPAGR